MISKEPSASQKRQFGASRDLQAFIVGNETIWGKIR